jgi:hypothetical protein
MRKNQLITGCAVFAGLSLGQSRVVLAGWSGQMNGLGVGHATANVTSVALVPAAANDSTTVSGQILGAAVQQTAAPAGFAFANLPGGSSASTTSTIQGFANYRWQATTYAFGGDKTDNEIIDEIMDVTPATFAALQLTTSLTTEDGRRKLNFDGIATEGTGVLFQVLQTESSQTTFDVQSFADDGPNLENIFYQPHLGQGEPLAAGQTPIGSLFHYEFFLPKDVDDEDLFVRIDGLASSIAAPDSGSLGLAFAVTVAGMVLARRFVAVPRASA